jgi:predicted Zn-dependent protease
VQYLGTAVDNVGYDAVKDDRFEVVEVLTQHPHNEQRLDKARRRAMKHNDILGYV